MLNRELTVREKGTLCGLIWYPDATDKEIAQRLGIPQSTVTAVRRRLREKGYFRFAYIPMLNMLGHELLVISYGKFSSGMNEEARKNFLIHARERNPKIFAQWRNHENWLMMSNATNYTEAKSNIDGLEEQFGGHGMEGVHLLFPYTVSELINFFDFRGITKEFLPPNMKSSFVWSKEEIGSYAREVLSKKEFAVLSGLVNYSEECISKIAGKVKVSRQCISRLERELKERKILKPIVIPNLHKLDYRYLLALHLQYKHSQKSEKARVAQAILENFPVIFFVSGCFESFLLLPTHTIEEGLEARKMVSELHQAHDFLRSLNQMFFPTQPMACLNEFDFRKCIGSKILA